MKNKELLELTKETLREQLQLLSEASQRAAANNDVNSLILCTSEIRAITDLLISLQSVLADC